MTIRVLVDTNILLDYLLKREPYEVSAAKIIKACQEKKIIGCIAAHSITNIFYILRKDFSSRERRKILLNLCRLFYVESIDSYKLISALQKEYFKDFEDCLQLECGIAFRADYIVTRNIADFNNNDVTAISPDEFCSLLEAKSNGNI